MDVQLLYLAIIVAIYAGITAYLGWLGWKHTKDAKDYRWQAGKFILF
jgi:Na+/proline symporter